MKKILSLLAVGAIVSASGSSMANGTPPPEAAPEGLEISGNVTVVTGYQHDDRDALGGAQGGMGDVLPSANTTGAGATVANADHFRFIVDQVEIDLQKSFGENIRLRADIDFGDFGDTASRQAATDYLDLEQAYVTANIGTGNGLEFLIGKFNAPVGVDSVDRNDNWLISYASPYRYFTPTNVTGAKLYYAFSDLVDLHIAVVNDLNGNGFGDSAIPSGLFRLGFNWGDEERKSTVGISGGAGPESDTAVAGGASHNAHFDFYGDLDMMVALSDTVTLAGEGIFRQSNSITGVGANQKGIGSFLALNYQASDVWDVTFRADFAWDLNPANARGGSGASTTGGNWIGYEGYLMGGTVGAGYQIADGAKMKMEYRFDFASTAGPAANSDYHSVMAEFAYSF